MTTEYRNTTMHESDGATHVSIGHRMDPVSDFRLHIQDEAWTDTNQWVHRFLLADGTWHVQEDPSAMLPDGLDIGLPITENVARLITGRNTERTRALEEKLADAEKRAELWARLAEASIDGEA